MTRNRVLDMFHDRPRPEFHPARLRGLIVLGLASALAVGRPAEARGAGIFHGLTAQDRSQPILLSATGAAIMPHAGHAASAPFSGKIPAYLAFPLGGGEHIPGGTPTISTGPQPGDGAVGPLALTPAVQGTLNADLLASRGAIVDAPGGSYAVAILPRYARALAMASSTSGTSAVTSILGLSPRANWTILGVSTNQLSQWYKAGTTEISHLTSTGATRAGKSMGLKVTPTSSGLNVAAERLIPPSSAPPPAADASVVAPEPGGWLVFGLLALAARLRLRAGGGPPAGTSIAI